MPRNGSGVYTLPAGNPVEPGTTIDAAWANDTLEDMANEITNSLSRTGAGGMIAPFRIADGTVTAPGMSFLNETGTGLYRSGAGSAWFSVLGVNVAQFSTVGLTIPFGKALTAQGNASVAGTFSVGGHTTLSSTLAVTGVLTASGGVTGNVTGNVTAASGTSTFNDVVITGALDMTAGSSATITGLSTPTNASDAANKGYVDTQVATRLALTGGTMSGVIAMGNSKITGLATPTSDQDAATKAYVDTVAQGLDVKGSCRVGTTANITLSGTQTIDGVAVIAGDRVLVKNQSSAAENGIYVVAAGSWSRAADADTWSELVGAFTFVEEGTVNDNSGWVCTSPQGGTLGVTAVTWEQFSGAGQITAGAGLFKSGNTINVGTASSARIVVGTDDIDLATTGVTASTYKSVTVDAYGRVTAGTNPTTLAGFGITDAYTQAQVDSLVAAKLSLTGGTMSGVIAMGANKITGLSDPTNPQDAATKSYIDTIFGSTTTAAASAAAAAASASAASTSATSAASSATAAAGSATSAASSYTTFNNQYLGSKTSDPTQNNTGGALVAGNLYWNSSANEMRVYNGSAWVAAYVPSAIYLPLAGGTMSGNISMGNNKVTGLATPSATGDAATKGYVDTALGSYLTTATAAATYQTISGMSSYLTTSAAASTYAALAGASFSGSISVGGSVGTTSTNHISVASGGVFTSNGATVNLGNNLKYNSGWYAIATGTSGLYNISGDVHTWYTGASATGGTTATLTAGLTLNTTGLGIGTSSPSARLTAKAIGNAYANSAALSLISTASQTTYITNVGGAMYVSNDGSTDHLVLSSSGNLGLGVTPSAANVSTFEVGYKGSAIASTASGQMNVLGNVYYSSGWKYANTGAATLYQQDGAGKHVWYTAASGTAGNAISFTQALTLDSSGNLGVGTTSPGSRLEVASATSTTLTIRNGSSAAASYGELFFAPFTGTTAASAYIRNIYFTNDSSAITFGTTSTASAPTERVRIDDNGNLLVGNSSNPNTARMYVRYDGVSTQPIINSASTTAAGTVWSHFLGQSGNGSSITTNNIFIRGNGNVENANNSYAGISDIKLKENIVDTTPKLEKLCQVRVVNYNLIGDYEKHKQLGVIAQELEQVFPGLVDESLDRDAHGNELGTTTKSVKYSVFVPMLIKAIQEQQAIIESLKARLDAANI